MVHVLLVYKEIFVPILFSPLLSRGDLKTGYIAMARIISLSTQLTLSGQIHDGAKLFASEEKRAKIRQGKNNPVNSIQLKFVMLLKSGNGLPVKFDEYKHEMVKIPVKQNKNYVSTTFPEKYHSLNLEKKYMQHWYYNTGTFFSWIL